MPALRLTRWFVVLSTLFIGFNLFSGTVYADYTFFDSFSSETPNSEWKTINNHPAPTITNDSLLFDVAGYTNKFPYIYLQGDSLPIKELSFNFSYQIEGGDYGSGLVLTKNARITEGIPPNDAGDYIIALYVLSNKRYYLFSPLCTTNPGCGMPINPYALAEFNPDINYDIKFTFSTEYLSVYINNTLLIDLKMSNYRADDIFIGNPEVTSTVKMWQKYSIDNIFVRYGDFDNSFPYYSQLDPLWKNVMYDNANEWASDGSQGIGNWGCAITSVAMMLSKYGIRMPDGTEATPLAINAWLKSQDDGYIGSGLLNWLAVSRLVRQSRTAGQADTDLEFVKSSGSAGDELTAGYYPILNTGGHFVIAYDHDSTNYLINDPLLSGEQSIAKSSTIASINTYIPSDTDLSYILISIPTDVEVALKHGGNNVGSSYSEYITDDITAGVSPTTKLIYLSSPVIGNYEISFDSPTEAAVEIIGYDLDGNAQIVKQNIPEGSSHYNYIYSHTTAPVLTAVDTDPPTYTGTNSFEGWYNSVQTATFNYTDDNLPDNFVPPSCRISTEGKNQVCQVRATVCDRYNNCRTDELTSNPANIDLTPPKPPITSWVLPWRPYSYVFWTQTKDSVKYRISWGSEQYNLVETQIVSHPYTWIYTPRMNYYYYSISAIDRAENESEGSRVERMRPRLWRYLWR